MFNWLINAAGILVGYAEMLGLKYPVKAYRFQVSDRLWRGSRLDAKAIADLANENFKMIVNLCAENDADTKPASYAKITAVHIGIMDNQPPKFEQVMQFLNLIMNDYNYPAYIHCEAGIGRTGEMVACYRMAVQGWKPEDALAEAVKFGLAMPNQKDFILDFGKRVANGEVLLMRIKRVV